MQRSYILSNKENEYIPEKSPLRLKINYQARQKYSQKSKSPLREQSFNHRRNMDNFKQDLTALFSGKKNQFHRIKIEESDIQPFSKFLCQNSFGINGRQSITDLSKIKPISLQNKKADNNNATQLSQTGGTIDKNQKTENQAYSKSRHRQNSKHLGFVAKVGNLQKMNHQISSLLSYVYENKTAPKDTKKQDETSSYKPRYGLISENVKPYQRRISELEKPRQAEPLVSKFDVQNNQNIQILRPKQRNNSFKYEYSTFGQINKSPYKQFQKSIQKRDDQKTPKPLKIDRSYRVNKDSKDKYKDQLNLQPLRSVKSQQITGAMNPSESAQKLSKLTTSNNPDLEFYYESLKKRDEQIQHFKQKLMGHENIKKDNFYQENLQQKISFNKNSAQINNQSLSAIYKAPFRRRNQARNYERQNHEINFDRKLLHQQWQNAERVEIKTPKKDLFVTEQQIEIYKDINKFQHGAHKQRTSSINRIEILNKITQDQSRKNKQKIDFLKNDKTYKYFQQIRKYQDQETQNSILCRKQQKLKLNQIKMQEKDKQGTLMTLKIQEQIQKIKNQLKDCKKQKSYLRQKYGSILSKQSQNKQKNLMSQQKKRLYEQKNSHKISVQVNENLDSREKSYIHYQNERMYDSQIDKQRYVNNLAIQASQNQHNQLRKAIISEKQYVQQEQQFKQAGLNFYRQRQEEYKCEQNILNDQVKFSDQMKRSTTQRRNQYEVEQFCEPECLKQVQAQQSFGQHSIKIQKQKTPRQTKALKDFQTLLHKVEISKPQTTKLGTLLAQKIQIDLKLRDQRQRFAKNTNSNKWSQLKSYLQARYNFNKSESELIQLLSIASQEHNPFSSTSISSAKSTNKFLNQNKFSNDTTSTEEIPLLCSLLSQSLNFFESRLLHKFSSKLFEKQHFSFRQLDLSSKGYLSLQDLICFVNLHTGKFYRNRDIIFLVKLVMIMQKNLNSQTCGGVQCYNSTKGTNQYRLSYEFLWDIFTNNNY